MVRIFFTLMVLFTASFLTADLSVASRPTTVLVGEKTQLKRPEGFRFSPSGDCIAVANSSDSSVGIYRRIGSSGCKYEETPACVIKNKGCLKYPHDVAFSSSGLYLAVASRDTDSIVFFKRNSLDDVMFDPVPYDVIKGKGAKLHRPAGLSFSPDDRYLAVANRKHLGSISFYRLIDEENFIFSKETILRIPSDFFVEHKLNSTHDVAFSPDGKSFAVVHKQYVGPEPGKTAFSIFEYSELANGELATELVFAQPVVDVKSLHSVSYDASGEYLAMTSEQEIVQIYKKKSGSNAFEFHRHFEVDKKGNVEGAKGVDFSKAENCIGVTMLEPALLVFETFSDD